MSTELKPVPARLEADSEVTLTQFCGPARTDPAHDRRRLQLTQRTGIVQVSKEQAVALAAALLQWVEDERPEAQ